MEIRSIACATSRKMHAAMPATRCTNSRKVSTRPIGSQCQRSVPAYARSESARQRDLTVLIYIATLADAVHVLHAFRKTSQKAARRDLDLAAARLLQLK